MVTAKGRSILKKKKEKRKKERKEKRKGDAGDRNAIEINKILRKELTKGGEENEHELSKRLNYCVTLI